MSDHHPEAENPTLWARWRRPTLVTLGLIVALGQWERIASGEPFRVATGLGVAGFFVSLAWLPARPNYEQTRSGSAIRRYGRKAAFFFGVWTVIACAWLATAAYFYTVRPLNFVVPAIPALAAASNLLLVRGADRIAGAHQR